MTKLSINPLHPAVGAKVEGLEPKRPLDAGTVSQLRAAFDERGVLVFPGLDIDAEFQRYLVFAMIGETPGPDDHRVQHVSNRTKNSSAPYGRLLFHCDNMWARRHQPVISLYGEAVEPPGAPTLFIHMADAWDRLPERLRKRVEGLEARHGFDHTYPNRGGDPDVIDATYDYSRSTIRPIAYRHPRTGRMLLYVSQQATIEILGLSEAENEALLEELFAYLYEPKAVLEHDWRQGDLVIWDNIGTQHGRGSVALQGPERTLRKVTGPLSLDADEMIMPTFPKLAGAMM